MKILHIIPSLRKGGAERLALDICRELMRRENVQVKLAVCSNENAYTVLSNEVRPVFVNSSVRPSLSGKWQVNTQGLDELIESFQPDVIHSHLFEAEVVSRYNLTDAAYVTHLHDNMPQMRNFSLQTLFNKKLLTEFYEKRYVVNRYRKSNNTFIAISKDAYDYFNKVLPADLRNIVLLNNAIYPEKFQKPANHQRKRKAAIELVTTGSLVDKKNQTYLIDVVKYLVDNKHDVHLHILGDGPNRKKLEEKTTSLQLNKQITFHGNVANVEEFLWNADVYAHPAYYEPFGLVLLEAMAADLPVVCCDGRGNRDIIRDGENGFMITENTPQAFAGKILLLMSNQTIYSNIKQAGLQTAMQHNMVNYIDRLLEIYSKLPLR